MAEIQSSSGDTKKGTRRSKKLSTRVDLTPMVDLGFLLITFFIFTTAITKPTAMHLTMPDDGDPTNAAAGKTISLLLAANNTVYYYNGDSIAQLHTTNLLASGLREVIRNKKQTVQEKYGDGKETLVIIKATPAASYGNVIDVLDEMQINAISRYVLVDAAADESKLVIQ